MFFLVCFKGGHNMVAKRIRTIKEILNFWKKNWENKNSWKKFNKSDPDLFEKMKFRRT